MKKLLLILLILIIACSDSKEFEPEVLEFEETKTKAEVIEVEKSNLKDELKKYCEMKVTAKIIYTIKNTVAGQTQTATQTVVIKGDDYKQETDTDSLYVINKEVYVCEKLEDWSCYHISQEDTPEQDCNVPDEVSVEFIDEKTYAGTNSKCYELKTEGFEGTDTYCFANDGSLVYSKNEDGTNSIERTSTYITHTLADAEFELPADPQELPNEMPNP